MHTHQLLLQLVKAKDRAGSSQERAKLLDVAKMSSMGEWSSGYYSDVAAVKVPKDRKPCLMPDTTKKCLISMFTKKGDDLKVDVQIFLVGHGVRDDHRLIMAAIFLRKSSSLCLISLEPAMELDSLLQ